MPATTLNITSNPDTQSGSPLFAVFPPEIRAQIFPIALSRVLDTSKPYPFDSYWYRPGYTAPRHTDVSLLQTCKRIYAEAKDLVWKEGSGNDEEAFWWGSGERAPPLATSCKILTSSYWSRIHTVHIFAQMYAFDSKAFFNLFAPRFGLRPHTVKVTIRYTDWWDWEHNARLHRTSITPKSHAEYVPESVQTLILELESAEHKNGELEEQAQGIVAEKMVWRWKRWDGVFLELDQSKGVKEWDWMGTARPNGKRFSHHSERYTMKYIVKVLTFTAKANSMSG
ncbi:hypothetical protein BKA70DRAFT_1350032 [Coprinopsis sp. MPI-PUGE-AT-0042]|nr:hypothetical protein BKA70DRAFT_1350032 [Coprinopsis sp. MPI-PUGE-AT-0042]